MTEIRTAFPPNIAKIRAVLPLSGREVFAWAGVIFNPGGGPVPPEIIAHEEVHFRQQGRFPRRWWKKFLKDEAFRLDQELEAHREEYRVFCRLHRDRNAQVLFLASLSRRLAKPMYGGLVSAAEAKALILS